MKKLLFIISILIICQAFGQDFKWEIRMYTLQNYIQTSFIKELTIASGNDSLEATESTKRVLLFDELGRMTEMEFLFYDKVPQFKVVYSYKEYEPLYSEKIMYRRDSTGRYRKETIGLTQFNSESNRIKELILSNEGDTLRKNTIQLNEENQIVFRESIIKGKLTYRAYFNYSKIGLFESSRFESKNHNQDGFIPVKNTRFQYDSLNQLENIIQIYGNDFTDTALRIDYDIKSDTSISFNQCTKMRIIKGETHSFHTNCNLYNISMTENGFYLEINNEHLKYSTYSHLHRFKFYQNNKKVRWDLNQFLYIFYAPIDVANTYY